MRKQIMQVCKCSEAGLLGQAGLDGWTEWWLLAHVQQAVRALGGEPCAAGWPPARLERSILRPPALPAPTLSLPCPCLPPPHLIAHPPAQVPSRPATAAEREGTLREIADLQQQSAALDALFEQRKAQFAGVLATLEQLQRSIDRDEPEESAVALPEGGAAAAAAAAGGKAAAAGAAGQQAAAMQVG